MESGDEDDAFSMGEREWQKMNRDLSKQGYREGKSAGREQGLQQSFEVAAIGALKYNLKLGQLAGMIEWKMANTGQKTPAKLDSFHESLSSEKEGCKREELMNASDVQGSMSSLEEKWKNTFQAQSNKIEKNDD